MCFCSFNGFCWVLWAEVLLSCFWVGLEITYKVILVFLYCHYVETLYDCFSVGLEINPKCDMSFFGVKFYRKRVKRDTTALIFQVQVISWDPLCVGKSKKKELRGKTFSVGGHFSGGKTCQGN